MKTGENTKNIGITYKGLKDSLKGNTTNQNAKSTKKKQGDYGL